MNNEQLQDWLYELHELFGIGGEQNQQADNNCNSHPSTSSLEERQQPILQRLAPQTNLLINYFLCNFDDSRLSEPLITQLLSLYYKFGIARCFVLQFVPTFIHSYLKALAKHWPASSKMLEMFFLAIYNEEILAAGPGTPSMAKKADDVRLPTLRLAKLANLSTNELGTPLPTRSRPSEAINLTVTKSAFGGSQVKLASTMTTTAPTTISSSSIPAGGSGGGSGSGGGTIGAGQKTFRTSVRIGPYPAIERIVAENRFLILTRLIRTVNQLLPEMAPDVVCRALCHSLLYICRSGFSFQESDFRQRVLREMASCEVFADFGRKSRIRGIPSNFLIECINGLTFSLLNGQPDIALRALDAIHQRAEYEMMADVLLETNALRHALSKSELIQTILEGQKTHQQQQWQPEKVNDAERMKEKERQKKMSAESNGKNNAQMATNSTNNSSVKTMTAAKAPNIQTQKAS